jgi:hypothetical protein
MTPIPKRIHHEERKNKKEPENKALDPALKLGDIEVH